MITWKEAVDRDWINLCLNDENTVLHSKWRRSTNNNHTDNGDSQ